MTIIHHHKRTIFPGQRGDLWQLCQIAIHRKHAIRSNQDEPRPPGPRGVQLRLQIGHVGIGIAKAPRLAQADAVDDAGMVQRIGNHRIIRPQKRLEQAAIGIETGGEKDGIIGAKIGGQPFLQHPVNILRAADEADAGHAIAMIMHRRLGSGHQPRIIGQTKVIVGAKVQHVAPGHLHMRALRPGNQAFPFGQPVPFDPGQDGPDVIQKRRPVRHGGISSVLSDIADCPCACQYHGLSLRRTHCHFTLAQILKSALCAGTTLHSSVRRIP